MSATAAQVAEVDDDEGQGRGRPPSETHRAIVQAAQALKRERAGSGQGATLLELVHRSQVGYKVARALVPKLAQRGQLQVVGQRVVPGRNRPAYEYAPVEPEPVPAEPVRAGWCNLVGCMTDWAR